MIKIDILLPTDCARVQELLDYEQHLAVPGSTAEQLPPYRGLTFWQHWLPCNWHLFPSVYVAKEDGAVIGLIALSSLSKSASCWKIDHLVVHPEHRGRGLAMELLRYVFALFGGQGVNHFVAYAEVSNSAALRLFASCGFKRAAKLTAFVTNDSHTTHNTDTSNSTAGSGMDSDTAHNTTYSTGQPHRATAADSRGLFQLFQDVLPPDIRVVFDYTLDDFKIIDSPTYNKVRSRLLGAKPQYWLWQDPQRQAITSAVKISLDLQGNAQLEFAVHPGWKHQANDFVRTCLQQLKNTAGVKTVSTCVFDFDSQLTEALKANGMETAGHYCLLTREHWIRAKQVKRARLSVPATIAKPAPI